MAKCDNRGTSRLDDWKRLGRALIGQEPARHKNPVLGYLMTLGHALKNIVVEEARRWGIELNPRTCDD
jgi:hypothetical protein